MHLYTSGKGAHIKVHHPAKPVYPKGGIIMANEKKLKEPELDNQTKNTKKPTPTSNSKQELQSQEKAPDDTWAADSQDELEDWIEEQGVQLRY